MIFVIEIDFHPGIESFSNQVSMIMSEGISRTKMKASDFRFTRVKGWLGGDQTERIEGWKTFIYEAAGKMKAVNTTKVCMTDLLINLLCALCLSCITLCSTFAGHKECAGCCLCIQSASLMPVTQADARAQL